MSQQQIVKTDRTIRNKNNEQSANEKKKQLQTNNVNTSANNYIFILKICTSKFTNYFQSPGACKTSEVET